MRLRRLALLAAVVLGFRLAYGLYYGHWRGPVTDADARAYLARIVAAAQAKDFAALCKLNRSAGTCRAELNAYCPDPDVPRPIQFPAERLEEECRESVPTEAPEVIGSRYQPPVRDYTPGRILTVRGVDGRGRPYETEVLIFWTGRGLTATHAVFWSGDKFTVYRQAAP